MPDEEKKDKLIKLIKRLYVIDSMLTGETKELVSEYNEIIEEVWNTIGGVEEKTTPSKILIRNNGGKK